VASGRGRAEEGPGDPAPPPSPATPTYGPGAVPVAASGGERLPAMAGRGHPVCPECRCVAGDLPDPSLGTVDSVILTIPPSGLYRTRAWPICADPASRVMWEDARVLPCPRPRRIRGGAAQEEGRLLPDPRGQSRAGHAKSRYQSTVITAVRPDHQQKTRRTALEQTEVLSPRRTA